VFEAYKNKVEQLFNLILTSGDPRKIALSVTFGFYLGIFPIVGTASVLCLITSFIFRLDHLFTQLVNAVVFPVQLLFIIPFYKIGCFLVDNTPVLVQPVTVIKLFNTESTYYFSELFSLVIGSILAWGLFSAATSILFFRLTHILFKRVYSR